MTIFISLCMIGSTGVMFVGTEVVSGLSDSWTAPVKISSNAYFDYWNGGFAVGDSGDAFVVWIPIVEWNSDNGYSTYPQLLASHFSPATGWSSPE